MLKALTIPLSWLYTIGVAIRHMLYDEHVLPSFTVSVPTICVGNLAMGGTGKTPMVEYLIRLLTAHGCHPAVLSRGYKRRTHGFVMADMSSTVHTIGDEAMQLHRKFPDIPIAVCESRVRGAKQLQRMVKDLDVILLDDAMQHRSLRCGFTILLTPYDHLYINDHMLPWGTLRDLPHRALKADAVVVTKCPDTMQPIDMRVIDNKLHLPTYQQLHFTGLSYAPMEQEGTPLVLCGIARPQYLMDYVRSRYPHAELMAFPDHHQYSSKDIRRVMDKARHYGFILTTEKDYQRLRTTDITEQLTMQNKRLIALPVSVRFCTPHELFDKQILTYVHENNRHT